MSGSDAYGLALRLLTGRDRSEKELRTALNKRGFDAQAIETAIERCRELGYVDDGRFALGRARSRLREGRAVGSRLLMDLRRSGIDEHLAEQAVDQALEETSTEEILRDLAERRFRDFIYTQADDKQRRRVIEFFLRRGFALSQVLSFFKEER